ncbi:Hsp20/alpha crystallin family protein [Natronorarus salvus]|uniref:Hsp20/alpha crystallin family protein n=1 Tax=Natronorarus salvus TaxID=3117733 RepID=UPI002F264E0B
MNEQTTESEGSNGNEAKLEEIVDELHHRFEELASIREEVDRIQQQLRILSARQQTIEQTAESPTSAQYRRPVPGAFKQAPNGRPPIPGGPGMQGSRPVGTGMAMGRPPLPGLPREGPRGGHRIPVDILNHDQEVSVVADLAGFEREDITLGFTEGVLHIRAARSGEDEDMAKTEGRTPYVRRERQPIVLRSIPIAEAIDDESVSATMAEGVLTVHLPKDTDGASTHRIEID